MPQLQPDTAAHDSTLSAQDLLAGSQLVHTVAVPGALLRPGDAQASDGEVRLRPLNVGAMALISRAARDDPALVPLLMLRESLVEPALTLDQVRQLHVGLVHFLVGEVNRASGLSTEGEAFDAAMRSPAARAHLLLARHFGWTPEQVAQLTPGQVMVYLSGIERLLAFEQAHARDST
jgi:acetamidase/formamidase